MIAGDARRVLHLGWVGVFRRRLDDRGALQPKEVLVAEQIKPPRSPMELAIEQVIVVPPVDLGDVD